VSVGSNGPATAMVIDDSRAIRLILSRTLSRFGFAPREAANAFEALGMLTFEPDLYSLLLVDWNMPGLTGVEFIRFVRAREEFRNLKILMVTTETNADMMMDALAAGADEYVMKPFTNDIIQGKLRLIGALAESADVSV
jgi:two-component system chemotaxis response regulator CheY